ncbi:MAG: outer membrane beta-barrel protein [Rhizobiales bacterium]|nr:outer membrane beta-barrel protein [Hyphomicrobiales bacterium]
METPRKLDTTKVSARQPRSPTTLASLKDGCARAPNVQLYDDLELLDGGTEDNGDREYAEPAVSIRATYSEPPSFKPFVEVGYAPRFHFKSTDRNGENRNSHGLNARAGVVIDRGPIWSGEAALVYSARDYEDSALKTANVLGVDAT